MEHYALFVIFEKKQQQLKLSVENYRWRIVDLVDKFFSPSNDLITSTVACMDVSISCELIDVRCLELALKTIHTFHAFARNDYTTEV